MERISMKLYPMTFQSISYFCLGFSLTGIYGLLDGVMLSIAIIIIINQIKEVKK